MKDKDTLEILKNGYKILEDGGIFNLENKKIHENTTEKGYKNCRIKVNGKGKTFLVHRLVAIWFIPNPQNKPEVNHKNGVKNDNRLSNLEWATPHENRIHAFSNGLHSAKGQKNPFSKLKDEDIIAIRRFYEINPKAKLKVFASKLNVTVQLICLIRKRKAWSHIK